MHACQGTKWNKISFLGLKKYHTKRLYYIWCAEQQNMFFISPIFAILSKFPKNLPMG